MAYFCVSYDLIAQKDYAGLIGRINEYDSVRVQLSFWLVSATTSASALKDDLAGYMDQDDKLMIVEFTKKPHFTKALQGTNSWLADHF